jgi:hypothetical protein
MDVKRYDFDGAFMKYNKTGEYAKMKDIEKHYIPRPDPMSKEEANELIHGLLASHYTAPLTHQAIRDKIIAALTTTRPDPAEEGLAYENWPAPTFKQPDPAEVEMIVDDCLRRYSLAHLALEDAVEENLYQEDIAECNERMDKARADLLKLVGGIKNECD